MFTEEAVLKLTKISKWCLYLLAINICWVISNALTLGILVGPITIYLLGLINRMIKKESFISSVLAEVDDFKKFFKRNFFIGFISIVSGTILYFDLTYSKNIYSIIFFGMTMFVFLGVQLFIYGVAVRYDWKSVKTCFKIAFSFFALSLPQTLCLFILIAGLYYVGLTKIPIIIVLFGVSIPLFLIMHVTQRAAFRIEEMERKKIKI